MDNPHMTPMPGCGHSAEPENFNCDYMVVGMAYVPVQRWEQVRTPEESLARGTQFADLDKPFFGEDVWVCE